MIGGARGDIKGENLEMLLTQRRARKMLIVAWRVVRVGGGSLLGELRWPRKCEMGVGRRGRIELGTMGRDTASMSK